MKSKFIIIVLLIIAVIVLACLMGPLIFNSYQNQRQESELAITSNITIYQEDNFTVRLSDTSGNPISGEQVNVRMFNETVSFDYSLTTDSDGVAVLGLEDKDFGKYTVNCTFNGNGQFKPSNTIQRIEVIQKVIEAPVYLNQPLNSYYNNTTSFENDSYSYSDYYSYEWTDGYDQYGGYYNESW